MTLRKIIVKYAVTTAVAGLMTALILWLREFSAAETLLEKYRILADAFTVPGVCLMLFFALVLVSRDGFFDSLGYIFTRVGHMFLPTARYKHQTYLDYKQAKREKKEKRASSPAHIFFIGLAYTVVAVVFTVLYYTVE